MLQTAQRSAKSKTKKAAPPHERFLEAFRWMLLARTLEEKLVSLYRGGLITGGVYIGKGQEAVSVACGLFLQKGDIFAPLIRDQAGRSAFGEPLLDVTDPDACLDVIGGAVKRARAGRPPQLVVASVLRLSGHGEHDDASYVTEEIKQQPFARDCLKVAEQTIIDLNLSDAETLAEWRKDAVAQVEEAIAAAQKEPAPEGDKEDWSAISTRDLVDSFE